MNGDLMVNLVSPFNRRLEVSRKMYPF